METNSDTGTGRPEQINIGAGTSQPIEPNEIEKVTVHKMPPFWRAKPKMWFLQIEAIFDRAKITRDKTKFQEVLCQLEPDVLGLIEDLFEEEEHLQTYAEIKRRIIEQFSDSETKRLQTLLQDLSLEDKKPSALLREMRTLAGSNLPDEFLRNLWMQHLPKQTQAILAVHTGGLAELALLADKIAEVAPSTTIAAVSATSSENTSGELNLLKKKIDDLTRLVNNLATRNPRERGRSPSAGREGGRSSSVGRETISLQLRTNPLCFYHRKFGDKATKCRHPCEKSENFHAGR